MPAREINPFTGLTRIRSQFLRTQWSTSNQQRVDMTTPQTAQPSGLADIYICNQGLKSTFFATSQHLLVRKIPTSKFTKPISNFGLVISYLFWLTNFCFCFWSQNKTVLSRMNLQWAPPVVQSEKCYIARIINQQNWLVANPYYFFKWRPFLLQRLIWFVNSTSSGTSTVQQDY